MRSERSDVVKAKKGRNDGTEGTEGTEGKRKRILSMEPGGITTDEESVISDTSTRL